MAIASIEYALIRKLRELGLLKPGGTLIEFGEANWYGDVTLDTLRVDIDAFAPDDRKKSLRAELDQVEAARPRFMDFDLARIFYDCFLAPSVRVAVDLLDFGGGAPSSPRSASSVSSQLPGSPPAERHQEARWEHAHGNSEFTKDDRRGGPGERFLNRRDAAALLPGRRVTAAGTDRRDRIQVRDGARLRLPAGCDPPRRQAGQPPGGDGWR